RHLFCRCLSDKRGAALRERRFGGAVSVAVCFAAGRGPLIVDCECALGDDEPDRRLCFVPRRPVAVAPDMADAALRCGRTGDGAPSGEDFWPFSRWTYVNACERWKTISTLWSLELKTVTEVG